ncbi:RNA-guided endonuclease InsQ/TnpB family protein [Streptomyces oryzae]|uniref:RNA-guided endonuclease InsQ/TnpB family protein n=1 Tax=Streptomyces oryzae TaxID=1434886 RepID=UPI0027DC2DAC|nr:transposase [Streptomyces oryzae]
MLEGRSYQAELTPSQSLLTDEWAGVCRIVWNTALEQRRCYRQRGSFIGFAAQCAELTAAKREFGWLKAPQSQVLQQVLRDLDIACARHGPARVRWRAKAGRNHWRPSFRFPQGGNPIRKLNRRWSAVYLPKLGWVRFRRSRPVDGDIRSVTLRQDGPRWCVSFLVETGEVAPQVSLETGRVGIDRGVVHAVATSDGQFFGREFLSPGERRRLLRLERQRSRCQPRSRRRNTCISKINIIRRRERDRRRDFQARTAVEVTNGMALVVLEDLKVSNMTRSAAGTIAEPGCNVAAKAGLNRAIRDKGWHGLELAIRNRARRSACVVRTVNPAYTSQTCPQCRAVDANSRKSQAVFVCTSCGHQENADTVGAKNTLAAGLGGHRAWRPRGCPVDEAPTSVNLQGINAPSIRGRDPRASAARGGGQSFMRLASSTEAEWRAR